MNANISPYTPIQSIMLEIKHRYDACAIGKSFEQFCESSRLRWFLELNDGCPYAADQKPPHYTAHYVRIWKHLAGAVVCCLEAKESAEKPLLTLLLQALEHCRAIDAIQAQLEQNLLDIHAARVKGGKLRQAALDPARHEAARLLSAYRPESGWPDATTAAKAIVEELKRFILAHRLSLVTGDHLVRTIVRWIRNVPSVTAAFMGTL